MRQIGLYKYCPSEMSIQEILSRQPQTKYNPERSLKLTCLVKLIPYERKSIQVINAFIQYALSIDFTNIASFAKNHFGQKAINSLKEELAKGQIKVQESTEPIERFLIMAIARGKNWEEIIKEYQLNLLFPAHKHKWQVRQVWLMLLCFIGFSERHGKVLVYRLLSRSQLPTMVIYRQALKQPYFKKKLQLWLNRSQQQLSNIYDDDERNILKAITSRASYSEALKMQCFTKIKFENMTKSRCNSLWFSFLCLKIKGNTNLQSPQIHWKRRSIVWKTQSISQLSKAEINGTHQFKLKDVMEKYDCFEEHFTDEVEIILLTAIKKDAGWLQTKALINNLFEDITEQPRRYDNTKRFDEDSIIYTKEESNDMRYNTYRARKIKQEKRRKEGLVQAKEQVKFEQVAKDENEDDDNILEYKKGKFQAQKAESNQLAKAQNGFSLNAQQKLVLSLLQKAKENIKRLQMDYMQTQADAKLYASLDSLQLQSHPSYETISQYNDESSKFSQRSNHQIQCLTRIIQLCNSTNKTHNLQKSSCKKQLESKDTNDLDPQVVFIDGYNKIVQKLGLPAHLRVNQDITLEERLKEEEEA